MEKLTNQTEFHQLVIEAKTMIRAAKYRALKAVNQELINLYLQLGKLIVERQSQYSWGRSVVDKLSQELQLEFPEQSGFSSRNLWLMREFYLELNQYEFLQPLVAEIDWTKNVVIFRSAHSMPTPFSRPPTMLCRQSMPPTSCCCSTTRTTSVTPD